MKTITLSIENDEFAEILVRMLEQMQFVQIHAKQKEEAENIELLSMTEEPKWDHKSIENNYFFNRASVVGRLDCELSANELVSMLSV